MLVLALAFLTACTRINPAPEEPHPETEPVAFTVMRVQLPGEVTTLDPARVQTLAEREVASLLFARLVRLDGITLEPVPSLAEKWSVSPDERTYTFTLRPQVRFASGREITAADWKYSWERALLPATASPTAPAILGNIAGTAAYLSGTTPAISGLAAPERYTLTVTLVSPDPDFPQRLAHPAAAVVDSWAVAGEGPDQREDSGAPAVAGPLGESGPYFLAEWVGGGPISLGKNQDYAWPLPEAPDRIEFRRQGDSFAALVDLEAARLDLLQVVSPGDLDQLAADPYWAAHLSVAPLLATQVLVLNPANPTVGDSLLRRALFLALDRGELAASLGEMARPAGDLIPPEPGTAAGNIPRPDREASRTLLKQYGLAQPAGVAALELGYAPEATNHVLAQGVQEQLATVGLKVELAALPLAELRQRVASGNLPLYLATAIPAVPGSGTILFDVPLPASAPPSQGIVASGDLSSPLDLSAGGPAATASAREQQDHLIPLVYPRLPVITRPQAPRLEISPMGEITVDVY